MKRWLVDLICLLMAMGACIQMFALKYRVIDKEEELKTIHRQILKDSRDIHMLEAAWASQNNPETLYRLVVAQTGLKPIEADQMVTLDSLPMRLVPPPMVKPDFSDENEASQ